MPATFAGAETSRTSSEVPIASISTAASTTPHSSCLGKTADRRRGARRRGPREQAHEHRGPTQQGRGPQVDAVRRARPTAPMRMARRRNSGVQTAVVMATTSSTMP
jgi:hypothetical protein